MGRLETLRQAAADSFGTAPVAIEPVHGGDLSRVMRLRWPDGTEIIAKLGPLVAREARMLRAIRAAGTPAPEILGLAGEVLFLEALPAAPPTANAWRELGAGLRRLHDHTGDTYGWAEDYAFGNVGIGNRRTEDWPSFWAERRLLPTAAHLPLELARRVERLSRHLPDLLPLHPRRSLLHGDLWSGNLLFGPGGRAWLIDPASYHGDAEVDLAMLTLFGTPGPGFAETYGETEPGAGLRRPIYQLWPALVHMRLFGAGYRGLVERCLDAACA